MFTSNSSPLPSGCRQHLTCSLAIILTGFGFAITVFYVWSFAGFWFTYTPDSASYIEAARSLVQGNGLMRTAPLTRLDLRMEPLSLWPPGYPLLIATASIISGLAAEDVALWLSHAATACVVSAVYYCLNVIFEKRTAVACAVMAGSSPVLLGCGVMALSDTIFLVLTLASLSLLFRATCDERFGSRKAFISGLIIGLAYVTRNAAVASLVAVAFSFTVAGLLRLMPLSKLYRLALFWFGGALLVAAPLWMRNLVEFGTVNPYSMPEVNSNLIAMGRELLRLTALDITSSATLARQIAWDVNIAAIVIAPIAIIMALGIWRFWHLASSNQRFGIILLLSYLAAGSAMSVIASAKWFGYVPPRLTIQYTWIALALCSVAILSLPTQRQWVLTGTLILLTLSISLGRASYLFDYHSQQVLLAKKLGHPENSLTSSEGPSLNKQVAKIVSEDKYLLALLGEAPEQAILFSNRADIFQIIMQRDARNLFLKPPFGGLNKELKATLSKLPWEAPNRLLYFIYIVPPSLLASGKDWRPLLESTLPMKFSLFASGPYWAIATTREGRS